MFWQICGDERSAVQLKMSDEIAAPMVFGMFRITLLIPGTAASTPSSPALLQTCLKHEWSHIKNGDLMTWNLIRLFQYPLWMQPFYWMLRNRLLADQDYLADDEACSDIADYAQILLNFATIRSVKEPGSVLGMAGRKSQIRRRIDMLLNEIKPTRTSNKRKLLLPLVLFIAITLFGSSLRFSESQEPGAPPQEPGTERSAVPGQKTPQPFAVPASAQKAQPNIPPIQRNGMQPWTAYYIESPDVLNIRVVKLVPKPPYLLQVFDVVAINVDGVPPELPVCGTFSIEPGGIVNLDVYGSVEIGGLSIEQARNAVQKHLEKQHPNVVVSMKLGRMTDMEKIDGDYPVSPDGYITLGTYGRVYVNGLTVQEAQEAIEFFLSKFLDKPRVVLTVESIQSKVYYAILKSATGRTEKILTFPCIGGDTIMKAVGYIEQSFRDPMNPRGQSERSSIVDRCTIKHIRPGASGEPVVTPLEWDRILFSKSGFGDNLQLLPDDRLVLEMKGE